MCQVYNTLCSLVTVRSTAHRRSARILVYPVYGRGSECISEQPRTAQRGYILGGHMIRALDYILEAPNASHYSYI
jgi:hypothetical protein